MTQEIDLQTIHGQSASPSLQKNDKFLIWLVVYLPSEKYVRSSVGMMIIYIPNIWKKKIHVPNHQPVDNLIPEDSRISPWVPTHLINLAFPGRPRKCLETPPTYRYWGVQPGIPWMYGIQTSVDSLNLWVARKKKVQCGAPQWCERWWT